MNFFNVRRVLGWETKRAARGLSLCVLVIVFLLFSQGSFAASLRIGLLDDVAPFMLPDSEAGILADEINILFNNGPAPELVNFSHSQNALYALRHQRIDMLLTAAPPSPSLQHSEPLLLFPSGVLRLQGKQKGATLRFPALPEQNALADALPGSATVDENVLRMIRGEASQLVAPAFLIEQYLSRNPVTTLTMGADSTVPPLHYFLWTFPRRKTLLDDVNRRISSLKQEDARWLEQKWLLPAGSVFSARNQPNSEQTPPLTLRIVLPYAPAPWVRITPKGDIRGVWYDLLTRLFPRNRFVLNFQMASASAPVEINDPHVDLRIIASQKPPSPQAQPFDTLSWGIVSPQSAPLNDVTSDKRLAIMRQSQLLPLLKHYRPAASLVPVDNLMQAIALLRAGGADGIIGETFSLSEMLKQNEALLRLAPLDLPETPLWFDAGSSRSPDVLNVQQVLASITPQVIQSSRVQHQIAPPTVAISHNTLWLIAMGFIALCAALIALTAWSAAQLQRHQRARDMAALHNALLLWQTLVNNAPVPLFVCDPSGRLTRFNATFSNAPFFTQPLQAGMSVAQLPLGELAQQFVLPQRLALLSNPDPLIGETTLQDGTTTLLWWLCRYTDNNNRPHGIVGGWVDISEKAALTQALNHALTQAERVSDEKSAFLARMSHDIRTPLNAVLGLLEMEREKSETLDVAWQAAVTLRDLIGDVLDISRIEAGELQLDIAPHLLLEILETSSAIFARSAQAKGLRWEIDLTIPSGCHVLCDKTRLNQVIANLLGNAIKYTPRGKVTFSACYEAGQLTLTIADTGVGIPPHALSMLGQAWFQVDQAQPQSSGLGLAICYQLVALMAGELTIVSEPEEGTTVTVRLPLPLTEAPVVIQPPPSAALPCRHVLIVDDSTPNLTVMRLQLEKLGQQVTCCDSAQAALDYLTGQQIDILITDCQMPQMDGYQLVRTLLVRDMLEQAHAPALILGCTANALPREEDYARHAGMDDLLRKPLMTSRLEQALTQHQAHDGESPDTSELAALADHQPDMIALMLQQIHEAVSQDLVALTQLTHPEPETLSRIAHRLKGSWRLLNMRRAMRCCLVLENWLEWREESAMSEMDITRLLAGFITVMRESLAQLSPLISDDTEG